METSDYSEKRTHTRAQFFLVRQDHDYVPVFAFRSPDEIEAVPALVVDASEGGVQILTTVNATVDGLHYDLEVHSADAAATPLPAWEVHRVWSRQEGMYVKSGFVFETTGVAQAEIAARLVSAEHHILRCVLHPRVVTTAEN
jgi:hypothetical protein